MDQNRDEEWIKKGVDIWMIRENLKLSFAERLAQHQDTLNFIDHLKKVKNHARPSSPPQGSDS